MKRALAVLILLLPATLALAGTQVVSFRAVDVAAPDLPPAELQQRWQQLASAGTPFLVRLEGGASLPHARQPVIEGVQYLRPVPPYSWIVRAVVRRAAPPSNLRWCGELPPQAKLGVGLARSVATDIVRVQRVDHTVATIRLDRNNTLDALLNDPEVIAVDAAHPPFRPANDVVRLITGAETVQANPWNLTGENITLGIWDEGDVKHPDFDGRLTNVRSVGTSEHATHVAGTMAGDGSLSDGRYRGIAPAAEIYAWDFEDPIADMPDAVEYGIAWNNNSWTYWISNDLENCSYLNTYDELSASYDALVRGDMLATPIGTVFAAGNMGGDTDCGIELRDGYSSLPPPGTAKNVVCVGSTDDGHDMSWYSSFGPTEDGRIKPDIVALGCQEPGTGYITSTLPPNVYGGDGWCGTSMATPQVTGAAALLLQLAERNGLDLFPAAVKALLIAGARDIQKRGPDYRSGYGHLDLPAAVAMLSNDGLTVGALSEEETVYELEVEIPVGLPMIELTLVWDDPAPSETAKQLLVNDLDLRLIDPGGGNYRPWVLNPDEPSAVATRSEDHTNNVEQVRIDDPAGGIWTVRVTATVLQVQQPFALAGWMLGDTSCDGDGDRSPGTQCGGDDCDDGDPDTHVGAPEICDDEIDNDCDGFVDEGCSEDTPDPIVVDDDEDDEDDEDNDGGGGGCSC